jgi:hypothetical protein
VILFGAPALVVALLLMLALGGPLLAFSPIAPVFLFALLGLPLLFAAVAALARRRSDLAEAHGGYVDQAVMPQERFAEVVGAAREDLLALADEIRELDLEIDMPGVSAAARADYGQALDCYERAARALDRAGEPADLRGVSEALEEGRYAMVSARARLEGREPPVRRPPCFFDPRHGPSVRDVNWAPPYGTPRRVPVCAADAIRIEEGFEPQARQVAVEGRRVPYWDAPVAYGPYAGGFFGGFGALLPGLLVGSLLGSAFSGQAAALMGWPGEEAGWLAESGFDDGHGGDFGG